MNPLLDLIQKNEKIVLGLMSGTSMDAVDAAIIKIAGSGTASHIENIGFLSNNYDLETKERLLKFNHQSSISELTQLDMIVGEYFAKSANLCVNKFLANGVIPDLIGSHGQTVYHNPPSINDGSPCTLQIGNIDVIAQRTGITTAGDFRVRDIVAGGEGAPIIPYVDYILFKIENETLIAQNIGGISNITVINKDKSSMEAFDTGPGNMVMDGLIRLHTDGKCDYDFEGQLASKGNINHNLLDQLLDDEYFFKAPPKSTGSEKFGQKLINKLYTLILNNEISIEDLLRTALELTVESIARAYERFVFPKFRINQIIVSGGGAGNKFLLNRLKARLSKYEIVLSDHYGIPFKAKEAIGMAVLANELISGNYSNIPSCTGARYEVPLGKISLGRIL
jgi:anhydro-N-acetylmuramic acid kinase